MVGLIPDSEIERCKVHALRFALGKVPAQSWSSKDPLWTALAFASTQSALWPARHFERRIELLNCRGHQCRTKKSATLWSVVSSGLTRCDSADGMCRSNGCQGLPPTPLGLFQAREVDALPADCILFGICLVLQVITGVPYDLHPDFIHELFTKHRIDYIVHGDDPCLLPDGTDAYEYPKKLGRFKAVKRTEGVSSTDIVGRMLLCRCASCDGLQMRKAFFLHLHTSFRLR